MTKDEVIKAWILMAMDGLTLARMIVARWPEYAKTDKDQKILDAAKALIRKAEGR